MALLRLAFFGSFALMLVVSTCALPVTELEAKRATKENVALQESLTQRRSWFFGHREVSDIMSGLSVIAASVDMIQARPGQDGFETTEKRFEDALETAEWLARFSLGMSEVYVFPATHLLFTKEDPETAMRVVKLGLIEERPDPRLLMLGGFLMHAFFRDAKEAGRYYKRLTELGPAPEWLVNHANTLLAGRDPYVENEGAQETILRVLERSFPKAKEFVERKMQEQAKEELP